MTVDLTPEDLEVLRQCLAVQPYHLVADIMAKLNAPVQFDPPPDFAER